jgi:hypothetical protein
MRDRRADGWHRDSHGCEGLEGHDLMPRQCDTGNVKKFERLDPMWLHIKITKAEREAERIGGDVAINYWKHRALSAESRLLRVKNKHVTFIIW